MGFSQQYVEWIMMCVELVDYLVIVNKDMVVHVIQSRGLRQWDPYYFCTCSSFVLKYSRLSFIELRIAETSLTLEYAETQMNGCYSIKILLYTLCWRIYRHLYLRRLRYWFEILRVGVSLKVKNLIWRMCRGCLPARARLQSKGLQCSSNCVSCAMLNMKILHTLFLNARYLFNMVC